jgi:hypothetical protein
MSQRESLDLFPARGRSEGVVEQPGKPVASVGVGTGTGSRLLLAVVRRRSPPAPALALPGPLSARGELLARTRDTLRAVERSPALGCRAIPVSRVVGMPGVQFRPYDFARCGLVHSPLAGKGIYQYEPES